MDDAYVCMMHAYKYVYIHNTKACVHTRHYRSSSENTWTDVMMLSGLLPAF